MGTSTEVALSRIAILENQELESPKGILPAELYCELLALYLLTNDLANAKFLWKRIPADVKSDSAELKAVWEVGKNAWQQNFAGVHTALDSYDWSEQCRPVMSQHKENLRENCLNMIAGSYTSVKITYLAQILGLDKSTALELVKNRGWEYSEEKEIVKPMKTKQIMECKPKNEEHLERLTQYILFLET
uniref:COP9 signalosome complex subunit 8 n=1 Tax=Phallusia mammillata TaxID=59560 RepID=A0A6F9D9P5_9ASCI|nr:COP9 signalosome complex subunit 8-like [Phallusia mammillata]